MSLIKAYTFPDGSLLPLTPGTLIRIYVRNYTANKRLLKEYPCEEIETAVKDFDELELPPTMRKHLYVLQNGEETKISTVKGKHLTAIDPFKFLSDKVAKPKDEYYQVTLSRIPEFMEYQFRNFGYKEQFGAVPPKKERFLALCVLAYFFSLDSERRETIVRLGQSKLIENSRQKFLEG